MEQLEYYCVECEGILTEKEVRECKEAGLEEHEYRCRHCKELYAADYFEVEEI